MSGKKSKSFPKQTLLALAFCLFANVLAAKDAPARAEGQLKIAGKTIVLVDVIAMPHPFGVEVLAQAQPFDRAELAEDEKLDEFDSIDLKYAAGPALVAFYAQLDKKSVFCVKVRGKDLKLELCDALKLELTTLSATRITGVISATNAGDSITLKFDAPIQSTLVPVVLGKPLPSDGGEPGKALNAHFAAMQSGDLTKILAISPPEQREAMQKRSPEEVKKMLSLMQTMALTEPKITGGSIDGEKAWVNFTGTRNGKVLTGKAKMARTSGMWRVIKISTK